MLASLDQSESDLVLNGLGLSYRRTSLLAEMR
jgi:hypothetical protein